MRVCDFPACVKPHIAGGWCRGHYNQAWRGKKLTKLRPRAANRKVAAAAAGSVPADKAAVCKTRATPGRKLLSPPLEPLRKEDPLWGPITRILGSSPLLAPTRAKADRMPDGWWFLVCCMCSGVYQREDVPANFYRSSKHKSGYQPRCVACDRARLAGYSKNYYANNRESIIAKNVAYAKKRAAVCKAAKEAGNV